jgi:hypothetical protein
MKLTLHVCAFLNMFHVFIEVKDVDLLSRQ